MYNTKVIKFLLSHGFEDDDDDNRFIKDSYVVHIDDTNEIEFMDENGNNFIVFEDFNFFKEYLIENRIIKEHNE